MKRRGAKSRARAPRREEDMVSAVLPPGAVDVALDRLFPPEPKYLWEPAAWVQDKLQRKLWSKQIEILEALKNHRMVAVKSCHGPGKSFTASCAGAWWLDPETHPLGSAFLVTTAPSWPQVEAILWREIRRRYREGRLRGRITQDCQWKMGDIGAKRADETEEIIGLGRKPADYDESTFQGIHARYFMAILDEAGGIPEALWNSVLALATNENSRILAIGNPDDPNSRFAKICQPGSGWHVIQISVWDTPNFTKEVIDEFRKIGAVPDGYVARNDEEVPDEMAESLVSPLWVRDRIKDWGINSPIWIAKVNGEFPDISDEYLFPPSLINKAIASDLAGLPAGRYGLDIARMGTDKSVLYRNRGGQIRLVAEWSKEDTMQSAGRAAQILRSHAPKRVPCTVDIIGLGAGVFDRLREQKLPVAPHQGSQRALNPAKFKNRRSEVYWTFRELMDDGLIDIDPTDEILQAQLGSLKWGVDSSGRIFVEAKEDLRERGLPSPDRADAAVLSTVAAASVVGVAQAESSKSNSITGDLLQKVM